ncbi:hypothetical protein [Roseibium sp.]|uniref:hypothetical protein n=1 Tax=Roseibium sp. TaxID=1936156 RepID=UPI003B5060AB
MKKVAKASGNSPPAHSAPSGIAGIAPGTTSANALSSVSNSDFPTGVPGGFPRPVSAPVPAARAPADTSVINPNGSKFAPEVFALRARHMSSTVIKQTSGQVFRWHKTLKDNVFYFRQTAPRRSGAARLADQAKHACYAPAAIGIAGSYLYSAANFEMALVARAVILKTRSAALDKVRRHKGRRFWKC